MALSRWRLFLGIVSLGTSGLFFHPVQSASVPHGPQCAQPMQARLNGVTLGILAYLQTHRSSYLDVVKTEGQAATALVRQFKVEAGSAHPELVARIVAAHERQRESALAMLNAEGLQVGARDAFTHEQSLLLQLLEEKFLSTTQASAWRGSDRLRWLLLAIAEVKGFAPETSGDLVAVKSAAFHQAMRSYRRETSARQATAIEDAQKRWDACVADVYKIGEQENAKKEGLARFMQARADLDAALDDYRRAPGTSIPEPFPRRFLTSVNLSCAGMLACWIAAFFLLRPFFRIRPVNAASVQRMAECVEAAASGDLSRLPKIATEPGFERLALGLLRLGGVLGRSENLVYHLASLVEASGDAIVSQNLEGKILMWNKGAQRLYGYGIEEVRGHSIGILSPMDHGVQLRQILERVKAGEKVTPFETLHQAKNGRLVRTLVKVSAIYDSLRQVIGVSFCAQELLSEPAGSTVIPLTDTLQRS